MDRVHDPDRVAVVRLARVHVVDVAAGEHGQLAALLAGAGVGAVVRGAAGEELLGDASAAAVAGLGGRPARTTVVVTAAGAEAEQRDEHGEREQRPQRRPRHGLGPFPRLRGALYNPLRFAVRYRVTARVSAVRRPAWADVPRAGSIATEDKGLRRDL
jgi:hypothetical protein